MLGKTKGEELFGKTDNYVMFDLETTGLDPEKDKIVEIGAVRVRNGVIVSEFQTLVNPEVTIPQEVIELHGITNEMTKNAPIIPFALLIFNAFVGDDILVGQNIQNFDMPFIWRDSFQEFGEYIENDYIDNLRLAREVLPDLESHSMKVLGELYGVDKSHAHRAVYDCYRQQIVYEELCKLIDK